MANVPTSIDIDATVQDVWDLVTDPTCEADESPARLTQLAEG